MFVFDLFLTHYKAVLLAAFLCQLFGALYYSPLLFGDFFITERRRLDPSFQPTGFAAAMVVQILSNLGQILGVALATDGVMSLSTSLMGALFFTLATSVLYGLTLVFWEGRSPVLFRLNSGLTLGNAIISALVFHLMK
mmetsp:Transcript_36575/g.91705  ORF Transcript_36575/g.91705 Transcript_36575/m.91705 type:complete len:138 (-) Transcript_36575:198-611(-)